MPYTHKKIGSKYVVYKKGKKVGETEGTKTALNKYLAALHIADNKSMKKESVNESHMPGHYECEDKVGTIYVVAKPTPGTPPHELVHTSDAFNMHQYNPAMVHGIYSDEAEANTVAEAVCNELYKQLKELEEKKHTVTEKIDKMVNRLQKEAARCMKEGDEEKAKSILEKITQLKEKGKMVEASKKPLEEISYEKSGLKNPKKADRDKNKDISKYEQTVGKAIEKSMKK